jgi:hypothetical protein
LTKKVPKKSRHSQGVCRWALLAISGIATTKHLPKAAPQAGCVSGAVFGPLFYGWLFCLFLICSYSFGPKTPFHLPAC